MRESLRALTILPGATKRRRRTKAKGPQWQRWIRDALAWIAARRSSRAQRRLHLRETISLGEKRFAAVVEFEDRRFLIGGAATSVSLLADLSAESFVTALSKRAAEAPEAK